MSRLATTLLILCSSLPLTACSPGEDDLTDEFYLEDTCKEWVEDDLKAPSTADFSDESVDSGPDSDGYYTVTGSVDAENSFGAQIRASWTCQVRVNDAGDGWVGEATLLE